MALAKATKNLNYQSKKVAIFDRKIWDFVCSYFFEEGQNLLNNSLTLK